jgi:hypothetical protein
MCFAMNGLSTALALTIFERVANLQGGSEMGAFPHLLVSLLVIHIKCQANITSHLEHSHWSLIGPAYKRGYLSGLLHFEG